jgi:hypothetical protein
MEKQKTLQRIPNEFSLNNEVIETQNYGNLTDETVYFGIFYPLLVHRLKSKTKNTPYNISVVIDEKKLKEYDKNKQKFYLDCLNNNGFISNPTQKESEIYLKVMDDIIYSQ